MNVVLRTTSLGTVLIAVSADQTEGPAGSAMVALDGGVRVWVDPVSPDELYVIQVLPGEEFAREVLTQLIGAEPAGRVMDALHEAGQSVEPPTTDRIEEIGVVLGPAWSDVTRLGFLLWLEQNAIRTLDRQALDLEIGVVAARLERWGMSDLAEERLNNGFSRLLELVGVESATDQPDPGQHPLLAEALDVVASSFSGGLASDYVAGLKSTAQSLRATSAIASVVSELDGDELLKAIARQEPERELAFAASLDGSADKTIGRFSVDWRQVPCNTLDAGENTVRASWSGHEDAVLHVVVRGLEAGDPHARISHALMFRAIVDDDQELMAAGELKFDAETSAYLGSCFFDRDLSGVHIDVFSVISVLPAATSTERARRAGVRNAATAFQHERIPGVDPRACAAVAIPLWRDAAARFRDADYALGGGTEDGRRAQLAAMRATLLEGVAAGSAEVEAWRGALPTEVLAESLWFARLRGSSS